MSRNKCPKNWKPGCGCSPAGLEPSEKCWIHGVPDWRFCPYCNKFRYNNRCTSCGCTYGISVEKDKDILYAYIWAIVGLLCLMPAIFVEGKSREMFLVAAGLFFIATIIQGRRLNFDLKTEDMVYGPW